MVSDKRSSRGSATKNMTKQDDKFVGSGLVPGAEFKALQNQQQASNDPLIAYQTAIQLYTLECTNVWARFNAMLVAHGIFVAILGQLLTTPNFKLSILIKALSAVGFFVCLLWLAITARGFGYHDAYLNFAKKQQLSFSSFEDFPVRPSAMPWWTFGTGWIPIRISACLVIVIFAVVYVSLFFNLFDIIM